MTFALSQLLLFCMSFSHCLGNSSLPQGRDCIWSSSGREGEDSPLVGKDQKVSFAPAKMTTPYNVYNKQTNTHSEIFCPNLPHQLLLSRHVLEVPGVVGQESFLCEVITIITVSSH